MRVAITADHNGVAMKERLVAELRRTHLDSGCVSG